MPYTIQTKDGIVIRNIPDEIPRDSEQIKQRVSQARTQRQQQGTGVDPDVPTEGNIQTDIVPQQQNSTVGEMALGGLEALGSLATAATGGLVGGTVGGIAGAIGELTGQIPENEGQELMQQGSSALTFEPRTEFGKQLMKDIGGALGALPAFMGGAPTAAARLGSTPSFRTVQSASKARNIGRRTLQNASSTRRALAEEIKEGNINAGNIAKTLDSDGTLIPNKNLKQAIKLMGDDDSAYSTAINLEKMSKSDKQVFNEMLSTINDNKKSLDPVKTMMDRPANAIGSRLEEKVLRLNKVKTDASRKVGELINGELGRKPVNVSSARNNFVNSLREADVDIGLNDKGKLVSDASNTLTNIDEVVKPDKLNNILGRLQSGNLSAKEAHRLKRNLREMVSFDPSKPGATRVSQEIETAFKRLSTELGDSVGGVDNRYKVANKKMSETIGELKKADRLLGSQIMIGDDLAVSKLGSLAKRIGTNLTSKEQVIDLIDSLDSALIKTGVRPKDNVKRQVAALADLEKIFNMEGAMAPWSLGGTTEKAINSALKGTQSVKDQAIDFATQKAKNLFGMSQLEFDDKMKALRKLSEVK